MYEQSKIKPNPKDLEFYGVKVRSIKVNLECLKCGRSWGYHFQGYDDFIERGLPEEYYKCSSCEAVERLAQRRGK